MKVLVTGGAGFIGSHVVDQLVERGFDVVVFDALLKAVHPTNDWPKYLRGDVERIKADVRDYPAIYRALESVDVVIHLAAAVGVGESAYRVTHYVDCNTVGTATLFEAIINHPNKPSRVLVAGSMSSYGEGLYKRDGTDVHVSPRTEQMLERRQWDYVDLESVPTSETKPFDIQSVYAQTKRDQEHLALLIGEQNDISVAVPRFFNVYGERQQLSNPYTGVAAIFSSMIANNNPPRIYEDGNQTRDFIHVSDIAHAVVELAVGEGKSFVGPVNIGTGRATSIKEMATTLLELHGKSEIGVEVVGKYRVGDIRHCFADVSVLREAIGTWEPKSLDLGLSMLVNWSEQQQCDDNTTNAHNELESRGLLR